VMAILNILRKGAYGDRLVRDGAWLREELLGHELGALTVGIVGLGNVGGTVARRLDGFGSSLVFTDPDPTRDHPGAKRVGLDELLRTADVVCLHVPLDVETRGLIGAEALAALKPGAILVNAARGPLVDEAALVEALGSGRLAGAALDVYEVEPLPAGSPLRDFDNVFLSPHIGGGTLEAEARVLEMVGANLLRMLDGEPPVNVVNAVLVAQK